MNYPNSRVVVTDLSRSFVTEAETVQAVNSVNFIGNPGEFICIHGASGSGKTTLINLLAGLDSPDGGEILVGSANVGELDEEGRARLRLEAIGVVFQEHSLVEEFTALENVALPLEVQGAKWPDASAAARAELDRVGLEGLESRMPSQLSGGQRQRVGIARALVGSRTVLLADEPTGALDSKSSVSLFELIGELCRQGALAIVCSHDPMCQDYADTVYEMVDGSLLLREAAQRSRQ